MLCPAKSRKSMSASPCTPRLSVVKMSSPRCFCQKMANSPSHAMGRTMTSAATFALRPGPRGDRCCLCRGPFRGHDWLARCSQEMAARACVIQGSRYSYMPHHRHSFVSWSSSMESVKLEPNMDGPDGGVRWASADVTTAEFLYYRPLHPRFH
jgi:hypothetical protein